MFTRMKIKRHIENVNFAQIDSDPTLEHYRQSGEYIALRWLKGYTEHRTGEPREYFISILRSISQRTSTDPVNDALAALTLLPYI
jgi:hypothetical protein